MKDKPGEVETLGKSSDDILVPYVLGTLAMSAMIAPDMIGTSIGVCVGYLLGRGVSWFGR